MITKKTLEYAEKHYPTGTWIMPITPTERYNEPFIVKGRIEISDYYYGVCHQGFGAIYYDGVWAEIVEKPLTSKMYNL